MTHPKTLLCPVDFSDASQKAARYAVELARVLGGRVSFVHVYHVPMHSAAVTAPREVGELAEGARKEVDQEFRALVSELSAHDLVDRTTLLVGVPAEQIVEYARAINADLIVLASMGYSGVAHLLMGSVAERVLRLSERPVLVVPL